MKKFFTALLMVCSFFLLSFSTNVYACKKNCKKTNTVKTETQVPKQGSTTQNTNVPDFVKNLKTINARHYADKVTQSSVAKDKNTIVNRKIVNVASDVQAIREGKARFLNNEFHINGRVYGHHDGTLFPVSGSGFYSLNRIEYKTLGVYNQLGNNDKANQILNNMKVDNATKDKVLRIFREIN